MEGIRIVELKPARVVTSGPNPLDGMGAFDAFFSKIALMGADAWFPRDFMWFDRVTQKMVWVYALPQDVTDDGGFETIELEGGLYAAAVSIDGDEGVEGDGERVYAAVKEWIARSGCFELDERAGHECMFHIVTPQAVKRALGYNQLDIYVPIKLKEDKL